MDVIFMDVSHPPYKNTQDKSWLCLCNFENSLITVSDDKLPVPRWRNIDVSGTAMYTYIYIRGRPINRFCRLIGTDSWFAGTIGYRQKSMPIVFRVASVAGAVENGLLSLYSTRAASGGGNHWQHVLFVLACDIEREIPDSHLNTADRKSCRGTERHSHSFLFNYIMYIYNDLGQI